MTKEEIITDIKDAVTKLNTAIKEANEQNLKVRLNQQFNPMYNAASLPLNPPVTVELSQSVTIGNEDSKTVNMESEIGIKYTSPFFPWPF